MPKILAFSGSNSSQSINQQLIQYAAGLLHTAEVEVISLIDYPAPIFGVDLLHAEGIPLTIQALHEKMRAADAYLLSTPEHNGSMPAVLKNTIDWLSMFDSKVFQSKPTVFLSTSTGARGAQSALDHLLTIMPHRGAQLVGSLSVPSFNQQFQDGILAQPYHDQLLEVLTKLEEAVSAD